MIIRLLFAIVLCTAAIPCWPDAVQPTSGLTQLSIGQRIADVDESMVPDLALRSCLKSSAIADSTVASLQRISCTASIQDWTGISLFPNLFYVEVNGDIGVPTDVSGLAEFAQIPALRALYLLSQGINDNALATLRSDRLVYLSLSGNPVTQASFTDITAHFPALYDLDLSNTHISTVENISELNIPRIKLNKNHRIKSYSALSAPGHKTFYFRLSAEHDLSVYSGMKLPAQITNLFFEGDVFTDLNKISDLHQHPDSLSKLWLVDAQLDSLAGLLRMPNLNFLFMKGNGQKNTPLKDVSLLSDLNGLKYLYLDAVTFESLLPVANLLPQLIDLRIINTTLADVTLLQGLAQAESLYLSNTLVRSIRPLFQLTQLKYLHLSELNHLPCHELDTLQQQLVSTTITLPDVCADTEVHTFRMRTGADIVSVDNEDPRLGTFVVKNGKMVFQPEKGVKGLVRMKVHIFYTGKTSLVTTVNIWVGPANGRKTGKFPWWLYNKAMQ